MRRRYVIQLQAHEPFLVSEQQTMGNYRPAATTVPGNTFRGAVAHLIQAYEGVTSSTFQTLFASDPSLQAHFGPLYPAVRRTDEGPRPLTSHSCKYHPGTRAGGHGVFDVMARQYALEVALDEGYSVSPTALDNLLCPLCEGPTEPFSEPEASFYRVSTTHVAINRARRVAEDGLLYTREGIQLPEGTYLTGWIDMPEALEPLLREVLKADTEIRIGANRSRGMGTCGVYLFEPLILDPNLRDRMLSFNLACTAAFDYYALQTGTDYDAHRWAKEGLLFSVDFRSEWIPGPGTLATNIKSPPGLSSIGARPLRHWLEWRQIGGWHAAARLPRRTRLAKRGSLLCTFEGKVDVKALQVLQSEGMGMLREQGYGQLIICHSSHAEIGF